MRQRDADRQTRPEGGVGLCDRSDHRTHNLLLRLFLALPLTLGIVNIAALQPAVAQNAPANTGGQLLQLPDSEKGLPMLVQADEMLYDYDNDRVIASGNVEIYYSDYALTAKKVIYDKKKDTVTAYGNVRLREPDGNVVFAEELTMSGDFRDGYVRSVSVLTPDNARVAAATSERVGGNIVVFNKAVYTACQVPENQPDSKPLWQIKAVKVVHNQENKTLEYTDATFELLGVPIAYVPYFTHPDPTVKRKSGFLTPRFSHTSELGATFEAPYFWAIAPDYDVTFNPRVTSKQGVLWKGEWRQRFISGSYYIRPAGIRQLDPKAFVAPGDTEWRGSIESAGEFRLGDQWVAGWDGLLTSDDTFLRVYDISDETDVVSQVYLTGQSERNYFDARAMHLKGLLEDDRTKELPLIHPVIDYNYLFADSVLGGELGFDVNVLSLTRDDGADSSRAIADIHWRRTFTDQLGQRYTPFFSLRGDLYRVNEVPGSVAGPGTESLARGMATAGLEYSYPFISAHEWGSQVIEPIAQIITRPNEQDRDKLPNEDAQSLVFDDTLLFDRDKFSGFDRVEGGTRANVGVRYTLQTNEWGHGSLLFGQSFHLAGDNPFASTTGLGTDRSDFVGALYLEPNDIFGFSSRFRLDSDDLTVKRHEFNGWLHYGPVTSSVTYATLKAQPLLTVGKDREEILASASLALTEQWRLSGQIRYDIDNEKRVQNGIGLTYLCDCATISLGYEEDFYRDRDDRPSRKITFRVDLKTLGGAAVSTGVGSSGSNNIAADN